MTFKTMKYFIVIRNHPNRTQLHAIIKTCTPTDVSTKYRNPLNYTGNWISPTHIQGLFCIPNLHNCLSRIYEKMLFSTVKTRAIANRSMLAFVRAKRNGCVLYNDYHQNIKKRTLINRVFRFHHCQIIVGFQSKIPLWRTWLDVLLADTP